MREAHPVAALFPMLDAERLDALAEDIKEHGQLHPIVLDKEGHILDGRNRAYACWKAGVEPEYVTWEGEDTAGYALAANGQRRDLSQGAKAMIAVEAESFAAKDKLSAESLGKRVGVSETPVIWARAVRKHAADLVPQVIAGGSLEQAYAKAIELRDAAQAAEEREKKRQAQLAALLRKLELTCEEIGGGVVVRPAPDLEEGPPSEDEIVQDFTPGIDEKIAAAKAAHRVLGDLINARNIVQGLASEEPPQGDAWRTLQSTAIRSGVSQLVDAAYALAEQYDLDKPESRIRRIR